MQKIYKTLQGGGGPQQKSLSVVAMLIILHISSIPIMAQPRQIILNKPPPQPATMDFNFNPFGHKPCPE